MSRSLFEDLQRYAGLEAADSRALQDALPVVQPHFPAIVEDFYRHILTHEGTRRILSGPEQLERLKHSLHRWLEAIFRGPYDTAYYQLRIKIGTTHARVGLPQGYVFAAMSHIRRLLEDALVQEFVDNPARLRAALTALAKVLDLELGLIAGAFHEADTYRQLAEQTSLARLGEMAAVVAHEVRNPLAGIRGTVQVIGSHLPDASSDRPMVREILDRIDALNGTIEEILLFARPKLPRISPVSLRTILEDAEQRVRQDPAMAGVSIRMECGEIALPADAPLLKTVFVNVLVNAAQAMEGKGTLTVAADARDGRCRIRFADPGPGIPEAIRDKIFEPFFTTRHRGTGLGLSIAKRVVDAHRGEIAVDCPPGGGTVVTITLPLE